MIPEILISMGIVMMSVHLPRVALFVDFENGFSSLKAEAGEAVAIRFANDPPRWLRWFERVPASSGDKRSNAVRSSSAHRHALRPGRQQERSLRKVRYAW